MTRISDSIILLHQQSKSYPGLCCFSASRVSPVCIMELSKVYWEQLMDREILTSAVRNLFVKHFGGKHLKRLIRLNSFINIFRCWASYDPVNQHFDMVDYILENYQA